uniref:Uncharacterized protein n=1 Tax=Lepeophtheirus salmonis TaxID=72036 RepID=A0A0K2TPF8_LEPSM
MTTQSTNSHILIANNPYMDFYNLRQVLICRSRVKDYSLQWQMMKGKCGP